LFCLFDGIDGAVIHGIDETGMEHLCGIAGDSGGRELASRTHAIIWFTDDAPQTPSALKTLIEREDCFSSHVAN
jgi:hypothetical protein